MTTDRPSTILHYITFHCIALHYIILQYITIQLHYIGHYSAPQHTTHPLTSYAMSMVAKPAATAAVSSSLSCPDSSASSSNAALSSEHKSVNFCLSPGGEPHRLAGYSQSRSSPSNSHVRKKSTASLTNAFL